jgi:hypothetical protein
MSDLRGTNLTEDLGMIDASRGPGALSLRAHTPSAGERWSRGPGSDLQVGPSLFAGQRLKIKR